jgi:hypothetical protein
MDPMRNLDLPVASWIVRPLGWTIAGLLFALAAVRLGGRPVDAWIAAPLGAIIVSIVSFSAPDIPPAILLPASVASALAPWLAIAFPPSPWRALLVGCNLALIVAADFLVSALGLPTWLARFVPIDPEALPPWLLTLPLDWPWKVLAAPILFGSFAGPPLECCGPVNSPLYVIVPATVIGLVIWYRGRRRLEAPHGWHGPAGRATRRG